MKPPARAPRQGLRPGVVVELAIEKGVYRGLGLARHEGQVVFVPHTLPGETVRARVERTGRGYANARVLEVVTPSSERRASPCPYVPRCGGCAHQEMDYAAQLRLKEAVLRDALGRSGVKWEGDLPLVPSPETEWRTRATLHLGAGAGALRLGLFEEGSHRVVDVEACLQLSSGLNRAARGILEVLRGHAQWATMVRGVELAESGDGTQRVACLLVQGDPAAAAAMAAIANEVAWLTGLGVANEEGGRFLSLTGDPYVTTPVGGVRFRAHVRSFFQGNRFLVEPLAQHVVSSLPEGGAVLDLYSGVGLFALLAARRAASVRGAEVSGSSVADARFNVEQAGLENVAFETIDVSSALRTWPRADDERVILDPPRTGAGPEVIDALVDREPSFIVYVSCDPPTLGRDLKGLLSRGYQIDSLRAFDLFPDTFHVETVAALRR